MKTTSSLTYFLLLSCVSFLLGCGSDDDNREPLTINGIYPNSNPIGGPVLIEGVNFTPQTVVYFNGVQATIEEQGTDFLTTKVPAGIGLGSKTIQIEDSNRLGEVSFDVLAQFPSDLPISPPSIFIPVTGSLVSPVYISQDAPCYYSLRNVYNTNHQMKLNINDWLATEDCAVICEFSERIDNQAFPLRNKWESEVLECVESNEIDDRKIEWIEVNRSGSSYQSDSFTGVIFTDENFEFPNEFQPPDDNWDKVTRNFLLLTSTNTGRQYLFVVTIYGFGD